MSNFENNRSMKSYQSSHRGNTHISTEWTCLLRTSKARGKKKMPKFNDDNELIVPFPILRIVYTNKFQEKHFFFLKTTRFTTCDFLGGFKNTG